MPTLLLDRDPVKPLGKISNVINPADEAFRTCGGCRGKVPVRTQMAVDKGDFRAMPAALRWCEDMKMGASTPRNSISRSTFGLEGGENR
jgi:hypothetical protein